MAKIKKTKRNVSETYMSPLVQNSKLLLICTRHYEFRTLYKAELNNQIRVRIHYHDQMAKKTKISESLDNLKHRAQKNSLTLTFEHVT